jgi:L-alanine-DL-glutamate epimerase-like enolase superfamily enzyme
VKIDGLRAAAYRVPTPAPESDGTIEWTSTTMVAVWLSAGPETGLGYTYAHQAVVPLIQDLLSPLVVGAEAADIPGLWAAMLAALRNQGQSGLSSCAVAAIDVAMWDLKARLMGVSLARLLGRAQTRIPVYGSGGFTSMSEPELERQLAGWVEAGLSMAKIKIGRHPEQDLDRVLAARRALGSKARLFVDANGAYQRKQALEQAHRFAAEADVRWFEEPVPMSDLEGLRFLRDHGPAGMSIAAGEYGYLPSDFRALLLAGAVDVLQVDATRCGGLTGFLQAAALCRAFDLPLSAHCAPTLHMFACCAVPAACHLEYFEDHQRIERLFLDGFISPKDGCLEPDVERPGLGLTLRESDAERYRVA